LTWEKNVVTPVVMNSKKKSIQQFFPNLDLKRFSILPVLENFFGGIIVTDQYGRVLFVNDEQARIDDMSAADLLGRKVTQIYHVDDGMSPTMKCIHKGSPVKGFACFYRTCTGKMVNSIHNVFPLFEGSHLIGTICFIQDFSIIEQQFDAVFKPEKRIDLQKNLKRTPLKPVQQKSNGTRFQFEDIIGESRELIESVDIAKLAARSISPILIFGETGTGKELIAQSVHNNSPRNQKKYMAINCAAIPESLLEGILFGTAKGAFTGAVNKEGLFEKANGGTLFLDEINCMSEGLQAKLLRFLQERKVRRVGSCNEIDIDLKIISSMNQHPQIAVSDGSLRPDLFYRLAVVFIQIPPLRDRLDDLSLLVPHFIHKINKVMDKQVKQVSDSVMALFKTHHWPGNVRELEHVLEGAMNLVENEGHIQSIHLKSHMAFFKTRHSSDTYKEVFGNNSEGAVLSRQEATMSLPENSRQNEIQLIKNALKKTAGQQSTASRILGISPQLLNYKMKKYRMNIKDFQINYP